MAKKIVALDVLTEILKKVYAKAKEYTNKQISIEVGSLRFLIGANSDNITALQNTTNTQQESINGLSSRLETAESNIATLQGELATVKSDVAVLQGKVYDYLGNDEIDKVFEQTEEGA